MVAWMAPRLTKVNFGRGVYVPLSQGSTVTCIAWKKNFRGNKAAEKKAPERGPLKIPAAAIQKDAISCRREGRVIYTEYSLYSYKKASVPDSVRPGPWYGIRAGDYFAPKSNF